MKKFSPTLLSVNRIAFGLTLVLCLFFLFYGISPLTRSYTEGYIGVQLGTDASSHIVLNPTPEREAANAGVETGDVLLMINGQPVPAGLVDSANLIRGSVGEPITISVQKADGSEKSYTIVRSELYQQRLASAGLRPGMLAGFYIILSLIVGLIFAVLAASLLFRRDANGLVVLAGFLLLLFPYSLNAASMAHDGALHANLDWLYNLLRAIGLFFTFWLLLVFPNGKFTPRWTRWVLIVVGIWMVPYYIDLVVTFLPAPLIDISWMVIIALGVGAQAFRTMKISTQTERERTGPVMQAAFVALVIYVVIWVTSRFVITLFSNPIQIWFSLIAELLVDTALLFFGFRLARSVRMAG
jgi:hypothetical protein